jgi:hypothetical protein
MSLIKYGIAAGLGYHFGRPQGRQQLEQLRRQVLQLSKRPEVKQWQERGWDIAYERALAAKRLASTTMAGRRKQVDPATSSATSVAHDTDPASPARIGELRGRSQRAAGWRRSRHSTSSTPADPTISISPEAAGTAAAPTGFGGRTVAEDSEAAHTGLVPPPPIGRTTPPSPAPRP